jgi:segregation and condensation protein A
MEYSISTERWSGPLEKLLELIEEKKMEITEVSLADVTGGFLSYVKSLETHNAPHMLIADFLVIASRLILIKSKFLIPSFEISEEEAQDIKGLEARLKFYQEFKPAQKRIQAGWSGVPRMYSREFLASRMPGFFPPKHVSSELMLASFQNAIGVLEKTVIPQERIKREIVSLKSKIQDVVRRLTSTPQAFSTFSGGKKDKGEVVVLFLAILHLIKEQHVHVEQSGHFDEIFLKKREGVDPSLVALEGEF